MNDYNSAYNVAKTMYEEGFICKQTYDILLKTLFCNITGVNVEKFMELDEKNREGEHDN